MSVFENEWGAPGTSGEWESPQYEAYEAEQLGELFETPELEGAFEYQGEHEAGELFELLGESAYELFGEFGGSGELLTEVQESELAAELLEITNEEELEEFLGKLVRGVAKGVGGFIRSPIGKALGGVLKNVARTALPMAAGALGNLVVPGLGGVVGSKLGTMASKMFELELNEMSPQEAEFEVARRYVRLASTAARHAALAPPSAPPRAVAQAAVLTAARRHAPGLAKATGGRLRGPDGRFLSAGRPAGGGSSARGTSRRTGARRPRRPYGAAPFAAVPYAPSPSWSSPSVVDQGGWYDGGEPSYDGASGDGRPSSGRWFRRDGKIVLIGL